MSIRKRFATRLLHVMGRGVNGCAVYGDRSDKEFFMKLLGDAAEGSEVRLHALVLMSNHYHFMLSGKMDAVSGFMYRLLCPFARAFNRRWERYGPLFQGRFHAVPIFNLMRALETSCYIHQNPVPPGLAPRAEDFEFSTVRYYLSGSGGTLPSWFDPGLIQGILNGLRPGVSIEYGKLLDLYRGDEEDSWVKSLVDEANARFKTKKEREEEVQV